MTTSSIFRILATVSVAKLITERVTRSGWTTFSSRMLAIAPFLIFNPADLFPSACNFLNSVTALMALIPAFSARVSGITSKACAKDLEMKYKNKIHIFSPFFRSFTYNSSPQRLVDLERGELDGPRVQFQEHLLQQL